jgi:hypothetical protein
MVAKKEQSLLDYCNDTSLSTMGIFSGMSTIDGGTLTTRFDTGELRPGIQRFINDGTLLCDRKYKFQLCVIKMDFTEAFVNAPVFILLNCPDSSRKGKDYVVIIRYWVSGHHYTETHYKSGFADLLNLKESPESQFMKFFKNCIWKYYEQACVLLVSRRTGGFYFSYDSKRHHESVESFIFMCSGKYEKLALDSRAYLEYPIVKLSNPLAFRRVSERTCEAYRRSH